MSVTAKFICGIGFMLFAADAGGAPGEVSKPNRMVWRVAFVTNVPEEESLRMVAQIEAKTRARFDRSGHRIATTLTVMQQGESVPGVVGKALSNAPDLVVVMAASLAEETRRQHATVPVIFKTSLDPAHNKLVADVTRPDRGMTGFTNQSMSRLKRWDLASQALPKAKKIGVLCTVTCDAPGSAALPLMLPNSVAVERVNWHPAMGYAALSHLVQSRSIAALDIDLGVFSPVQTPDFIAWAKAQRVATFFFSDWYVRQGGLISLASVPLDNVDTLSDFIVQVVQGVPVAALPVRYPTRLRITANLNTAEQLGVRIPREFLLRIDNWIR